MFYTVGSAHDRQRAQPFCVASALTFRGSRLPRLLHHLEHDCKGDGQEDVIGILDPHIHQLSLPGVTRNVRARHWMMVGNVAFSGH
jgi:hypothetical protein